jgi:hypothetical protein
VLTRRCFGEELESATAGKLHTTPCGKTFASRVPESRFPEFRTEGNRLRLIYATSRWKPLIRLPLAAVSELLMSVTIHATNTGFREA